MPGRRITFIAPFGLRPKGTASSRALPLAQALVARGHSVRLIVPPWDDASAPPEGRVSWAGGMEVVELPRPRLPGVIGWPAALLREALGDGSDVVHVFKPKAYAGLVGLGLSALRRPWVLDTDDWEGRGGWNRLNHYSAAERALFDWQERTLPRLAGAVTVASRTLQTQAWGLGVPPGRVFYLPNGVSAATYAPLLAGAADTGLAYRLREKLELHAADEVLLLYTRFVEFPVGWPLRVLRALAADWPRLRLLVVGAGFGGEEGLLRDAAEGTGLGDRVIVSGRVEGVELGALLSLGTLALYPMRDTLVSRAKCPVKLLDLMALGLPIVAHRVGQVGEYLAHNESGLLAPPGDLDELASGAAALLADPARRASLGAAARERAWSVFPWERLAEAAEVAYARVLGRAGRASSRLSTTIGGR